MHHRHAAAQLVQDICICTVFVLGQDEFVLDLLELLSNVATMKKFLLTTYIAYCPRIKRHCQKT
jgi:hypothetical protein